MNPILKYAGIYGLLSGLVVILTLIAGFTLGDQVKIFHTEWFGYLVMLVAMTFLFVGMKRYRDVERGGVIKFLPAFGMGLATAVVAGLVYVVIWEIFLASTNYAFINDYFAGHVRELQASGAPSAEIAKQVAEMEAMRVGYANPLIRLPMTFLEIFPVGFGVALFSAVALQFPKFLPAR